MTGKENARPVGCTTGQATETAAEQAAISYSYSNTDSGGRQPKIVEILCRDRENALTMRELRQLIDGDSRSIRLEIEYARRHGVPIVSDCQRGYLIAETKAEIESFCRSMRARAFEINRTASLMQFLTLEAPDGGNK